MSKSTYGTAVGGASDSTRTEYATAAAPRSTAASPELTLHRERNLKFQASMQHGLSAIAAGFLGYLGSRVYCAVTGKYSEEPQEPSQIVPRLLLEPEAFDVHPAAYMKFYNLQKFVERSQLDLMPDVGAAAGALRAYASGGGEREEGGGGGDAAKESSREMERRRLSLRRMYEKALFNFDRAAYLKKSVAQNGFEYGDMACAEEYVRKCIQSILKLKEELDKVVDVRMIHVVESDCTAIVGFAKSLEKWIYTAMKNLNSRVAPLRGL